MLGNKGGGGRSTVSLVLAHGLALLDREVTLVECVHAGTAARPPSGSVTALPVSADRARRTALRRRPCRSDRQRGGDRRRRVRCATTARTRRPRRFLGLFDLILLPVHPDPLDLNAARHFLEELDGIEPGWKAVPPRWVIHVDPIQSLRGSLSLVDALVKGWRSESMPPLVLPWTLPHLSRPDLRALGSAALVTGSLAATCRGPCNCSDGTRRCTPGDSPSPGSGGEATG